MAWLSGSLNASVFTELDSINCIGSRIEALKVDHLPKLKVLRADSNLLTSLDVTGCNALEVLACEQSMSATKITSLQTGLLPNLRELICNYNSILVLDLQLYPKLEYLNCSLNKIAYLDATGLSKLLTLSCSTNSLPGADLKVSGLKQLQYLNCAGNKLTTLDLTGIEDLDRLICNNNQITSLFINHLNKMISLDCRNNKIPELLLDNLTELFHVYCDNNKITKLDLTNLGKLGIFSCDYNQVGPLLLGNHPEMYNLSCIGNHIAQIDIRGAGKITTPDENNLPRNFRANLQTVLLDTVLIDELEDKLYFPFDTILYNGEQLSQTSEIAPYDTVSPLYTIVSLSDNKGSFTFSFLRNDSPVPAGQFNKGVKFAGTVTVPWKRVKRTVPPPSVTENYLKVVLHDFYFKCYTTDPVGGNYFVKESDCFTFKFIYEDCCEVPYGFNPTVLVNGDTLRPDAEGNYTICDIREMKDIEIIPNARPVGNESLTGGTKVWTADGKININLEKEQPVTIYNTLGQLIYQAELPIGDTTLPLSKGVYLVRLASGKTTKVQL